MDTTARARIAITPLGIVALILFVALCTWVEYVFWAREHASNMDELLGASDGVLSGMPHWRAFQNRLLTPYLMDLFRNVSQNPYNEFAKVFLTLENFVLCICAYALTRRVSLTIVALVASSALWVYCMHYFSYPWDFTESMMLTLLFLLAIRSEGIFPFVILFILFVLSRESCTFIGLFLILRGVSPIAFGRRMEVRSLTWGGILIVVGVAITEVLRKTLFKASMLPGVGADTLHEKFENHFHYLHNGKVFLVGSKGYDISLIYAMLMLVFLACAYVGYREKARNLLAIGITMTLYTLSIFIFGVLDEVRLYQPMTGILSLTVLYLLFETGSGQKWRATNLPFLTRRGWS
ncbi:hypothetical protein PPMP20_12630 [Paraburkholderia phymatum]|uniref:Glycosyltransferase RgtA/B/C/D-like domain-containing protein n=1 Tax=Paraburkholderia phymatum (strain DSM 17167 / CIP 108236 / LMG 21445 / STM815) TaxID=391038 RepID=B2JF83_PARP8|nr:hypothetical protein [Paraburkholderia phymatum]ACC71451.1 hypothetical protein Bphy_2276 [Paraburkholderia phymatum STM815]